MTPDKPFPPLDREREISILIGSLHRTEQRLEELTGGEVDTVADQDGRISMLRRAQEYMRRNVAVKEAAILDALPANIALLDSQGCVISVNGAWQRFGEDNGLKTAEYGIGLNYIEICRTAQGDDAAEAEQVGAGIGSVLSGAAASFSIEYPCHSPTEKRWFEMTATPMAEVAPRGAVVMHLNITERKLSESKLLRFGAAMDASADAIYLVDRATMAFIHVNDAACHMREQTREELFALGPVEVLGTSRARLERTYDGVIAHGGHGVPLVRKRLRQDGSEVVFELQRHAVRAGDSWLIVTVERDITERKQAEQALRESERRFSSLLSNVELISVMLDSGARISYCNDYLLKLAGWRFEEVIGRDWFDLFIAPELHAVQQKFFHQILAELPEAMHAEHEIITRAGERRIIRWNSSVLRSGTDLVVGIASIGEDITEYRRTSEELQFKNSMLQTQQETSLDAILVVGPDARIISNNHQFIDLWKLSPQHIGAGLDAAPMIKAVAAQVLDPEAFTARVQYLYAHQEVKSAEELLLKDGRSIERYSAPITAANNKYYGRVWYFRDITAQKQAKARVERQNRIYAVLSGINSLIVRARDRDELLREACGIAVDNGKFTRAAIALMDPASKRLVQVASRGFEQSPFKGMTGEVNEGIDDGPSLLSQAIRERKPAIANDVRDSPGLSFSEELLASGSRAIAVLPLVVDGEVVGAIVLHSDQSNLFDHEELRLLLELAGDISFALDHIEKINQVAHLAYYDQLTGLARRSLFLERLAQHLRSAAGGRHKLAVLLIDLERFKNINDSLGWVAGDALLQQVAKWLTLKNGDDDLVARIGADHFAVVLPEVKSDGNLARLVENMLAAFVGHPFRLIDSVFHVACRVGISVYPEDGADCETLFRNAEAALKKAKRQGERYLFYTQKMTESTAGRPSLENQLHQAIDREEFVLHYQPKVNLDGGKLVGAEALIRWNDPHTGLVPPGRFVPILEETGLIFEVGRWALKQAVADYLRWRAAGLPAVRIAVNVSPLQLRHRDFVTDIERIIGVNALASEGLEVEITESVIMQDIENTIVSLGAIRALGVSIAIDDFGTGFSSLSYLAKLPVDTLKIDRSFVIEMTVGPEGLALVSTIIQLAHSLKLEVVAEGVETEEQSRLLRLLSCDQMQGFLLSKPVPAEVFEARFLVPPRTG
ncbi:MAG: EAL domain-containing protein [Ideonella sp.]